MPKSSNYFAPFHFSSKRIFLGGMENRNDEATTFWALGKKSEHEKVLMNKVLIASSNQQCSNISSSVEISPFIESHYQRILNIIVTCPNMTLILN